MDFLKTGKYNVSNLMAMLEEGHKRHCHLVIHFKVKPSKVLLTMYRYCNMIIRATYPKAKFNYAEMFYKMYYSRQSSHGGKIISGTCPNAPSGPFSLLRQQSCPQTPTLPRNLVFLKYKYSPMSYEQKQVQKCWNKQQHFKYILKCNHGYLHFCHQYFHH